MRVSTLGSYVDPLDPKTQTELKKQFIGPPYPTLLHNKHTHSETGRMTDTSGH